MEGFLHHPLTTLARTRQPSDGHSAQLVRMTHASLNRARLTPIVLVAMIVIAAAVAIYHALDSWYLQTANATRLRADYSEIAATRFSEHVSEALKADVGTTPSQAERYEPLFAALFDSVRLLPAGVPTPGGNAAAFAMHITDADGNAVFRSGDPAKQPYSAKDTIVPGELVVTVAARKSAVAWLATEHLASRMMLILWLTVLSAVAAIVALRLMRREARLVEARTGFVSSVSHELRTPLAQIQILLETLRLGRFNTDAQREWTLEGMQREVTRLTTLVNNVLQFSSSDRRGGPGMIQRSPTDMASFLERVVDGFRPLASVRGVAIEVDVPSGSIASIDPDSFTQVILNILDNAVKYGPDSQTIRVSGTTDGRTFRLSIADEGAGISEADRPRVWNAFERGSSVEKSGVAGSGIGLAVVRDIVEAHGGTVYVDGAFDEGARFVIEIPVMGSSEEIAPLRSTAENARR